MVSDVVAKTFIHDDADTQRKQRANRAENILHMHEVKAGKKGK